MADLLPRVLHPRKPSRASPDYTDTVATLTLTHERPVMTRQFLGKMPNDSYVKDQPFVPNVPAADAGEQDVYQLAPELDAGGGLRLVTHTEQVEASPYNPSLRALGCGLLSAATAATVASLTGGIPAGIAAGLTALTLGGGLGLLTARNDQVSVQTREEVVSTPVMTGYRMGSVNEAFSPVKGKGTLHFAMPSLENRPVGLARTQFVGHSALSHEKAALASAALGLAVGLGAGLVPSL